MLIPTTKLPQYFYDPCGTITELGRPPMKRFIDQFSQPTYEKRYEGVGRSIVIPDSESPRLVLTPAEIKLKKSRDNTYSKWLTLHNLRPKSMIWQLIRVHGTKHSANQNRPPWWDRFQDAVFRVFMQPETVYEGVGWQQWYLLCPEDVEMVMRYRLLQKGIRKPPRNVITERWISNDKELRKALLIPVECCQHYRHETTAGVLPMGL